MTLSDRSQLWDPHTKWLVFDAQSPAEVMEIEDSCMQTPADQGAAL